MSPVVYNDTLEAVNHILSVLDVLRQFKSLDTVLDRILLEARRLTCADAGTIFMVEGGRLVFAHVHNDTLFSDEDVIKHGYLKASLPIDDTSISGYAANHGVVVSVDDAYAIAPSFPYQFNTRFDERTGYRTRSILALPIKSSTGSVIALMQIINSQSPDGQHVPFSAEDQTLLNLLAGHAASFIENAIVTRELVLRMNKMAELRDPSETGMHVQRVGAFAAEIYHRYAKLRGVADDEMKRRKDLLQIAAMLHDVGKVGVSDLILKKPGKLTFEEFETMKLHTLFGARLFAHPVSELDAMAYEVALYHHAKFDGSGYPGLVQNVMEDSLVGLVPLAGHDIPLSARIVSLADVYDALASRRVYKPAFPEDMTLAIIRDGTGKHFDPDVVSAFFDIHDIILAIRDKFGNIASNQLLNT
ncbi:GAF and HD-GYP domain-containing protein [Desulfovibrio inopinatus]|uniref:GAF and HD-GYP domain-containing protein n=1 Tax=Desulfovibrio inopinatus TaxID=102109 RepID=UPI000420BC7B|nr:HD domain-containing phosphohydrolase [Desulfovibrio inopinatus]